MGRRTDLVWSRTVVAVGDRGSDDGFQMTRWEGKGRGNFSRWSTRIVCVVGMNA